MSEKELRELDIWICEHVYGRIIPNYTTDPAASMEVLKKLLVRYEIFISTNLDGRYLVAVDDGDKFNEKLSALAPTLELAIALLARKIYETKEPNL